ncbi:MULTISPECIES: hypothetical protein [Acetobacter]|uniref:hypothetical protein n=1 Tax=Acetobacter TaxID=434 RepID=UPI000676C259|nr:hypothetical protein [Acetobacter pasteurianus]AKR48600.1 hypothetical protein DB34_06455 [Acetobacter pasteurianus]
MSNIPQTPSELLWKLAYFVTDAIGQASCESELRLDLEATTQLMQRIKKVLPQDNEWSAYLTPFMIWRTVYSVQRHFFYTDRYKTEDDIIKLIDDSVLHLKKAFSSTDDSAEKSTIASDSFLSRGLLTT